MLDIFQSCHNYLLQDIASNLKEDLFYFKPYPWFNIYLEMLKFTTFNQERSDYLFQYQLYYF